MVERDRDVKILVDEARKQKRWRIGLICGFILMVITAACILIVVGSNDSKVQSNTKQVDKAQVVADRTSRRATRISAKQDRILQCLTESQDISGCLRLEIPQGLQGDRGDRGDRGLSGAQGPKGDKGNPGSDGKDGNDGEDGSNGEDGNDGTTGVQGERGPQGEKGETGAQGAPGQTGPQGEKGDTGPQGPVCPDGYIPMDAIVKNSGGEDVEAVVCGKPTVTTTSSVPVF